MYNLRPENAEEPDFSGVGAGAGGSDPTGVGADVGGADGEAVVLSTHGRMFVATSLHPYSGRQSWIRVMSAQVLAVLHAQPQLL